MTDGFHIIPVTVDETTTVDLTVNWSNGGGDYEKLRPLSYSGSHVFALCFALSAPTSLNHIEERVRPSRHQRRIWLKIDASGFPRYSSMVPAYQSSWWDASWICGRTLQSLHSCELHRNLPLLRSG
jgi:hypothetical protein